MQRLALLAGRMGNDPHNQEIGQVLLEDYRKNQGWDRDRLLLACAHHTAVHRKYGNPLDCANRFGAAMGIARAAITVKHMSHRALSAPRAGRGSFVSGLVLEIFSNIVGWAERSEARHVSTSRKLMGFAVLSPSYNCCFHSTQKVSFRV